MSEQVKSEQSSSDALLKMLTAAEQIADGLADLALAIYDCDNRLRDQLAAANAASVHMQEACREAERALWEKSQVM